MIPLLFLTVITISQANGQIFQKKCPPTENIKPCVCKSLEKDLSSLQCSHFTKDELLKVMKNVQRYSLAEVIISHSNIGKLPSNAFQGMNIKNIIIQNSNITMLGDSINRPPFIGLENSLNIIKIQEIFQNKTLPLKFLSLSHLKKLQVLSSNSNFVPEIGNDWFESGPYDLKELYFIDSSTSKLGSHVFTFLTELKSLSVTGGSIQTITRGMLPNPARHLEYLDLSKNSFVVLPTDIFANMPSLEFVHLEKNALTSIDELMWSPVWHQLITVNLLGNPLNCDNNLKWIFQYRLPDILQGNCAKPQNKDGKDLKKLTLKDFS